MSNRYSGFPASVFLNTTEIHLRQLESHSYAANSSKSFITTGGSLDRNSAGLHSARPVHTFASRDIHTLLTNIPPATGIISDASGEVGPPASAHWRYQQRQCESGFKGNGAGNHIGRYSAQGYVRPVSVTSSEDDTDGAIMNCEYYSESLTGIVFPETKATVADYTAAGIQPTFVNQFFHGPTYLNGTIVNGIDAATVNFGLNISAKLFDKPFPTCYVVESRTPSISLTGTDSAIDAALQQFINTSSGIWAQYYRKGLQGNSRVPEATATHIKLSSATSEWCVNDESWSQTGDNQVTVEIQAVSAAIAVNLATAIP